VGVQKNLFDEEKCREGEKKKKEQKRVKINNRDRIIK
jgi:hypothetical protein